MNAEVTAHPAATVIVVRDGEAGLETLLVKRSAHLAFHGGSWVFPGGRLDDADFQTYGRDDIEAAARCAAVRECREEVGLDIDRTTLVAWSHWTTPPGRDRRFATWFYLTPAPVGAQQLVVDGGEIHDHRWFTPAEALAQRRQGHIGLPPPTFVSIVQLSDCATVAEAIERARRHPAPVVEPKPVRVEGGVVAVYQGDAAYESAPHGLDQSGDRHRLTMLGDEWRYENSRMAR